MGMGSTAHLIEAAPNEFLSEAKNEGQGFYKLTLPLSDAFLRVFELRCLRWPY